MYLQVFLDTSDAYVWLYDPVPWYYWGVGTVIVLGVIGVCLFPLWPPQLRLGVHYLSIAAAGFLVSFNRYSGTGILNTFGIQMVGICLVFQ